MCDVMWNVYNPISVCDDWLCDVMELIMMKCVDDDSDGSVWWWCKVVCVWMYVCEDVMCVWCGMCDCDDVCDDVCVDVSSSDKIDVW